MEENLNNIFKAYDVRGIYKKQLDEELFEKIAKATANFLKPKTLIVASDTRESSPSLKKSVIEGLVLEGVNVIDIGIATTPMFYWAINKENTDGGMMITASHNPPEYNGLKISREKSISIGENSGLLNIKELTLKNQFEESIKIGTVTKKDLLPSYVDFLAGDLLDVNLKITADFACGASSFEVNKLAEKLNFSLSSLCEAGEEEVHEGNPLKEENVADLVKKIKEEKTDLGVAFDTDADRIFFFDPEGKRINSAAIASLITEEYLKKEIGAKFVGSINISRTFKNTTEEHGGEYLKSRVGHVFLKQVMRENNAVFGAESSGHFYFKDFFYADSGIFTMVKILEILKSSGKNISELTKKYNTQFNSGELNFETKDKEKTMEDIKKLFPEGKVDELDGVTVECEDFWINARPSNTEPLLRVTIEAESESTLNEVVKRIEELIK